MKADRARSLTRKLMAIAAMSAAILIGVGASGAGLFSDILCHRVVELTAFLTMVIGGFLAVVGYYFQVGSSETKHNQSLTVVRPNRGAPGMDPGLRDGGEQV